MEAKENQATKKDRFRNLFKSLPNRRQMIQNLSKSKQNRPKFGPKSVQNRPRIVPKPSRKRLPRGTRRIYPEKLFRIRSGTDLGADLGPSCGHFWSIFRSFFGLNFRYRFWYDFGFDFEWFWGRFLKVFVINFGLLWSEILNRGKLRKHCKNQWFLMFFHG